MTIVLEERKVYGDKWVHSGAFELHDSANFVAVHSWATGGAPAEYRFRIRCQKTQKLIYDSGNVKTDGRMFMCSRFYLITLFEPGTDLSEKGFCELLDNKAFWQDYEEIEFSSSERSNR